MENHDYKKIAIRLTVEKLMEHLDSNKEPYSPATMKKKLIDRYVVKLQRKVGTIIDRFYKKLRKNEDYSNCCAITKRRHKAICIGESYLPVNFMTL